MKRLLQLTLVAIFSSFAMAAQSATGTISLYVFKDETPLHGSVVTVDGKRVFKSDIDGSLKVTVPVGKHTIEVVGRGTDRVNLGYLKRSVLVKEDRDTQVIANFTSTAKVPLVTVDTPVGKLIREKSKAQAGVTGKGRLNGVVLSSEGKTPIAGARVFVKGTAVDARTDSNGRFSVEVPSGVPLSISVVHTAYSAQTIGGVKVPKDGTVSRRITLTPASMELEEYVVLAPKVEGSLSDVITEEKNINAVANILGAEEMKKKGDSTAAAALRRVTGVTLVDGRSIYVRGLGERYSNVELNSMPLPSPNPMKRTVPLDIFPAAVIGSMKVQKSGSADIPASFGGGYIDIRTKERFDEDYIKVSISGEYTSYTGDAVVDYMGSATDWTGYDRSFRAIPQPILDATQIRVGEVPVSFTTQDFTEQELSDFTQMYPSRIYEVYPSALRPGFGGSIEGAKSFDIGDDHHFTIFGTYGYKQKNRYVPESYYNYSFDKDGVLIREADQNGTVERNSMTVSHGGMLNIGYNYMDVLRLKYTKLYTKNSVKSTRVTEGIMGSNYEYLYYYSLDWEEREMNVDQLSGDLDYVLFGLNSNFAFGLQYSTAEYYQPNNYRYIYIKDFSGAIHLDHTKQNHLSNYLESDDTLTALNLKNRHEFSLFGEGEYVEYGFTLSSKERVARQYKYYLDKDKPDSWDLDDRYMIQPIDTVYEMFVYPAYPYNERLLNVATLFRSSGNYDGYVDERDLFVSWMLKPVEKLEVLVGMRYVTLDQTLDEYLPDRQNGGRIAVFPSTLSINDYFPSISIKYKYDEKQMIDFAASKTYVMPDMREVATGEYFHPTDIATVVGNPDLVYTVIYSYDLKYSYFFSDTENIKVGLYYKEMQDPIEDVMLPTSSLPIYSFINADTATLYGLELDGRKNLDFIDSRLANYYIAGNFSYNVSEVLLKEEQKTFLTTDKRDLQGLSPYVVNLTLGYNNETRSVSLNYNYMAERIRKVGVVDGLNRMPDQYEQPPALLDLIWIEKFHYGYDFEVGVKLGNILDDETVWSVDGLPTRKFKRGRSASVKVSAKF